MSRWLKFYLCAIVVATIIDQFALWSGSLTEVKTPRLDVVNKIHFPRVLHPGIIPSQYRLNDQYPIDYDELPNILDMFEEQHNEEEVYAYQETDCVSKDDWQETSFPTCNTLHEVNIKAFHTELIAHGSLRNAWKVHSSVRGIDTVIFKNPRISGKFNLFTYESNRKEGLIMERLTSSPNVVGIYGFCGQSMMSELARPLLERDINMKSFSIMQRLQFAANAAEGVADIHETGRTTSGLASVVHRDVKPENFLLSLDFDRLIIDDFNYAEFRKEHEHEKGLCPLQKLNVACEDGPIRDSPEECYGLSAVNEKTDVYKLGNVLYYLLTGLIPYVVFRGSNSIQPGVLPPLPEEYETSTDPAVVAMREAIYSCYVYRAEQRPEAREIADVLSKAIEDLSYY